MNTFMGATVGGAFGAIGWEVGFETDDPDERFRGHQPASASSSTTASAVARSTTTWRIQSGADDNSTWTAGYSHGLGSGVKVIGEHRDRDSDGTLSILAVVVGF